LSEKRNPKKGKNKSAAATASGKAASSANSPIDVGLLAQIVELMAANDLNTVDVRNGDRRVILKRGAVTAPVQVVQAPMAPALSVNPGAVAAASAVAPATPGGPAIEDESAFLRIKSPMVGTFYASPKPGEKPFVSVGSAVSEDTDVCIIEAMKTFNNIKAECRGTIARVLAQDGQPVEFGTTLYLVKPS
jgi:acetyl-CoA carboxylase biotin carboxyl carrier protein